MRNPKIEIPLTECKHGFLYHIHSRNLSFGVFNEKTKGFVGIREKFREYFLFTEYHWDTGAPYGTVNPKTCLEQCPIENLDERTETVATPDDVKTLKHLDVGDIFLKMNQELFDWLEAKEKQYKDLNEY